MILIRKGSAASTNHLPYPRPTRNPTRSTPSTGADSSLAAKPPAEDSDHHNVRSTLPFQANRPTDTGVQSARPPPQTTKAAMYAITTPDPTNGPLYSESAKPISTTAKKHTLANPDASTGSNLKTNRRETSQRGAGNKLRSVPRSRSREFTLRTRSKDQTQVAHRWRGNSVNPPSLPTI